ncbi:MAG: hypothetical protein LUE21_03660 [Oscillospiraceae bacterium]|nr:hypothetical protein [Oscillospiraceae bacterium]
MRALQLQSVCRKKRYNYTLSTPKATAENILNRNFHADKPNEEWMTDVTEFKWYEGVSGTQAVSECRFKLVQQTDCGIKIGVSNNRLVFDTYNTGRYQRRLKCMTPMELHAAA